MIGASDGHHYLGHRIAAGACGTDRQNLGSWPKKMRAPPFSSRRADIAGSRRTVRC
jgi:hypothetical protein